MKTILLAVLGITIATASLTLGLLHSHEPSYHNKKLSVWLTHLDSLDAEEWRRGAEAIRALGTNSLPFLAQRLRAKESPIRQKLLEFFDAYPVVVLVPVEAHFDSALEAARILGPLASPLIPEIVPFLGDNRRAKAVKVLVAVGASSVPALVRELANSDPAVRAGAAVALGSIAGQPDQAVKALAERLGDSDAEVRMTAAWALGRFGANAQPATLQLSALTNDLAHNVREQAGLALARIRSGSSGSK